MKMIDLSAIFALCDALPQMTALIELNLSNHKLGVEGTTKIADVLTSTKITNLNLAENNLTNYGEDMSAVIKLADAFTKMPNLREVNVAGNYLGEEGGMKLAEAFTQMPNLQTVNLDNNQLCGVAQNCHGTFTLDAINAICDALTKSNIQSISLDSNMLCGKVYEGEFTLDAINAICDALTKSNVQSISVDGHPLPIDELRGVKPTETIDLSSKKLGVPSGIIISSCIAGNEHLKSLSLADNRLTKNGEDMSGVMKLAEVLSSTKIEQLNLAKNDIDNLAMNYINDRVAPNVGIKWD